MTAMTYAADPANAFVVDAVEPGARLRPDATAAVIGADLRLSISGLEILLLRSMAAGAF